jgi:hypothetical protein
MEQFLILLLFPEIFPEILMWAIEK